MQSALNIINIIISIIAGIATIVGTVFAIVRFIQGKRDWGEAIKILGITAVVVGIIVTTGILLALRTPTESGITPNATDTSTSNTNFTPNPKGTVTPQEVQTWCSVIGPGTCDISRFEQLPTAAGGVDFSQVHMKSGAPVKITIPQGFSAYIWDCFKGFTAKGPTVQPQVCEMKVWRSS